MGLTFDELEQSRIMSAILLVLASLVTFATAADMLSHHSNGVNDDIKQHSAQLGWAVACGLISFLVSLVFVALYKFMNDLAVSIAPYVSAFFVLWWAFGVGFLTGSSGTDCEKHLSAFAETNNGYFAVWLAFIASIYMLYLSVDQIQTALEGRDFVNGLVTVALASIIEFCAAADQGGSHGWAIACGLIAFTVAFIQMVLRAYATDLSKRTAPVVSVFLVLWWTFGVAFITGASGPFYNTCCERANGFLSTWIAFLSSVYFCFKTLVDYEKPSPILLNDEEGQGFSHSAPRGQGAGYNVVAPETED